MMVILLMVMGVHQLALLKLDGTVLPQLRIAKATAMNIVEIYNIWAKKVLSRRLNLHVTMET